jgi:DNA-binding response OmpR family regulator
MSITPETDVLAGKTLLIVEDDWILQNLLINKLGDLQKRGTKILSAFDGKKAVELAKENRPNLILLDILLPEMTGFEFLKELYKEDESYKKIPVIVFSNLSSEADREQGRELGVREYLVKADTSVEEITEKIIAILSEEAT